MRLERSRRAVRRVRAIPPVNRTVTDALLWGHRRLGKTPDLAVRRLPRVGVIEAALPDGSPMRFVTEGEDGVAHHIYWLGWDGYEPETAHLVWTVCSSGVDVMVDVGAHIGYFSILGALSGAERVLSMEPMFIAQQLLARNIRANGLEEKIEVCCFAAGAETSVAPLLTRADGTLPSGSSLAGEPWMGQDHDEVTVAVHTVDEIVDRAGGGRVGLIKIDTETTEPEVLAGAAEVLKRDRPIVIAEVLPSGSSDRLTEAIEPFDYRAFRISAGGLLEAEEIVAVEEERNWALVPSEMDVAPLRSPEPGA